MYNEVIELAKESKELNQYGDWVPVESLREVFADARSIGMKEFYEAQAHGFQPEIKFVIADYLDYEDEKKLYYTPYGGVREAYDIIRTYRSGFNLELTCKRSVER